jgi:hypothetical protein
MGVPMPSPHADIHENVFSPGVTVPWHFHETEEVIVVLEGDGECRTDEGTENYSAGDIIILPPRVKHSINFISAASPPALKNGSISFIDSPKPLSSSSTTFFPSIVRSLTAVTLSGTSKIRSTARYQRSVMCRRTPCAMRWSRSDGAPHSIWNVFNRDRATALKYYADVARLYRSFLVARRAASPVAWLN